MKKYAALLGLALGVVLPMRAQNTLAGNLTVQNTVKYVGILTPTGMTADVNDYAPTNFGTNTILRLSSDQADRTITGLAGGAKGRIVYITNIGAYDIKFSHASSSSTAANRFDVGGADYSLPRGNTLALYYDDTSLRWRPLGSLAAGGGGGGGTGTVTSVTVIGNNGITQTVDSPNTDPLITLGLGNITPTSVAATGNVTGANLSGTNTGDQTDATLTFSDVTTNNASTTKHGFLPKLDGNTAHYLDGSGNFSTPAGGGGSGTVTSVSVTTANGVSGSVANSTSTPAITLTLGAITPTSVAATGNVTGANLSGTNTGDQTSVTGNAGTATALQTARNINGVAFDGTASITVTAAAGTLTGGTLASGVTHSSLVDAAGGTFGTAAFTDATAYEVPITFSSPLSRSVNTISIANAAADGTTKGASTFTAADFNAASGVISLDYTNGQAASSSTKGFLTSTDWSTFNGKESALTFSTPLSRSTNTISIVDAAADGSTKGASTFTAADFNATAGLVSLDYTNGQKATASVPGFLSSTDWSTFNGKESALTFSAPLSRSTNTISVVDAAADGSTKGAATFAAADFNATSGVVSLDYTNGQKASASVPGFLSSTDWSTFNNKLSSNQTITLSGDTSGSGTTAITTTTAKVNGVAYPTSPSTNTVPVVTNTNQITYQTVPNAALTNSSITIQGSSVSLGGSALATTSTPQFARIGLGAAADSTATVLAENDSVGATSTDGIILKNATAATSGNQKWSPRLRFTGQGWKTTSTAASQTVDWINELRPVQGTTNPSSTLTWSYQVNGGGYSDLVTLDSTAGMSVDRGSGALPSAPTGISSILRLAESGTNSVAIDGMGWGTNGLNVLGRGFSGTRASPTATADGQVLLLMAGYGYDTGYNGLPKGRASIQADGLWSGTNNGTYHTWWGTPNASTTMAEWMRLQNGKLAVGGTPTVFKLHVFGGDTNNVLFAGATKGTRFVANSVGTSIEGVDSGGVTSYQPIVLGGSTVGFAISGTEKVSINSSGNVKFAAYGAGTLVTDASGNITASSDERLKDIVGSYTHGLDALAGIQPIMYYWKTETGFDRSHSYTGFSAQNVQKNLPEAVDTDPRGMLTLQDRALLAALVNAVKELKSENEELRARVQALEAKPQNNLFGAAVSVPCTANN